MGSFPDAYNDPKFVSCRAPYEVIRADSEILKLLLVEFGMLGFENAEFRSEIRNPDND